MYININTNQYPVSEGEIRNAYPNTSFSEPFQPPEDYAWVFSSPPPVHNEVTEYVREILPILTSKGTWEKNWEVLPLDQKTIDAKTIERANEVRSTRNAKLVQSDWTQVADSPVDKAVWATYRQSLRELTAQPGFPFDITWPIEPVPVPELEALL